MGWKLKPKILRPESSPSLEILILFNFYIIASSVPSGVIWSCRLQQSLQSEKWVGRRTHPPFSRFISAAPSPTQVPFHSHRQTPTPISFPGHAPPNLPFPATEDPQLICKFSPLFNFTFSFLFLLVLLRLSVKHIGFLSLYLAMVRWILRGKGEGFSMAVSWFC